MKDWIERNWKEIITLNGILTVVGFITALVALFSEECLPDSLIYVYGAYIAIIGVILVHREFIYSRKARYAEAMASFHQCMHSLRNASAAIMVENELLTRQDITNAINEFQKAFSLLTGANCRACIKTLVYDSANSKALTETFVRGRYDGEDCPINEKDNFTPIESNTDFKMLSEFLCNYFFSNDLSKESPYMNSNWPDKHSERKNFVKQKKYDYISTIVWPIRGRHGEKNPEIVGFLCIDSMTRGIFSRRYDKDSGAIVSDALYSIIKLYTETFPKRDKEPLEKTGQ